MTVMLAEAYPRFLDDLAHNNQLRPNTLRAYHYELAAAAADPRFLKPLPELALSELEAWIGRGPTRTDRRLPRPIQRQTEQDAIDNAIRSAPQPYRLIFTTLRETGMRPVP